MSDKTPDEVIRLAQEQIAARRTSAVVGRVRRETPWRWLFLSAFGVLMIALLFSPGAPLEWKMYAVVHGICAQQHNIFLGDLQFPLCARNSGIYMSFMLTLIYLFLIGRGRAGRIPPWPITITLLGFVVLMAVDGFNSLFVDLRLPHLYTPMNWLRTLTGMGMGIAIATLLLLIFNVTLRRDVEDQTPFCAMCGNSAGSYWSIFWPSPRSTAT